MVVVIICVLILLDYVEGSGGISILYHLRRIGQKLLAISPFQNEADSNLENLTCRLQHTASRHTSYIYLAPHPHPGRNLVPHTPT